MTARAPYQTLIPEGLKTLGAVFLYTTRSGIDKTLLDLVFLRASQINGCAYCIDMHTADALRDGASTERLMLVSAWHEAGAHFTARERAALAWTEAITQIATSHASDDAYAAARVQFSEKALADLTLAIGVINAYNRLGVAFRRPPESLARLTATAS